MSVELIFLVCVLAIPLAINLITLIVFMREVRCIRFIVPLEQTPTADAAPNSSNPYAPIAGRDQELYLSPWAKLQCDQLFRLNYRYLGPYRHAKGGIFKIRYDVWVSEDNAILAMISAGQLLIPVKGLFFYSLGRPLNGVNAKCHCYASISAEAGFAGDPAKLTKTMLFRGVEAMEMDQLHRLRLQNCDVLSYQADPVADFADYRRKSFEDCVFRGLIVPIDLSAGTWRPTLTTAFKLFLENQWFVLSRKFYSDTKRVRRKN